MITFSREGNIAPEADCNLRKNNTNSICSSCKNILDVCKELKKDKVVNEGFICVTRCEGFESIKSA